MAGMIRRVRSHAIRGSMALLHAACVATIALPVPLLRPVAALAQVQSQTAHPGFAEESATMGLVASDRVLVETAGVTAQGRPVHLVTSAATAPPGTATTPLFYRRFSSYDVEGPGETLVSIVESELRVAEENEHVTIEVIDRVPQAADSIESPLADLVGLEIRRRVELDFGGFEAMVATVTAPGGPGYDDLPALLARMWENSDIELRNFRHTVTVLHPDGSETIFPGDRFDFAGLIAELTDGAQTSGKTIYDCYADIGVDLTVFGAACLIAGTVICAAACAVSAGIACIPCISGAALACGLGTAFGSLGYCLAKVIFGVDPPPTNTPVPTSTRTPTRTATPAIPGDCDGDGHVTVGELILGVRIALEREVVSRCSSLDSNRDGHLGIGELIAGVRAALAR